MLEVVFPSVICLCRNTIFGKVIILLSISPSAKKQLGKLWYDFYMYYIVGLGNPGEKYQNTRHNIGFMVLDTLSISTELPLPVPKAQFSGRISEGKWQKETVIMLYPDTFMNNSGGAVKQIVPTNLINHLVVIHDDVDLALGQVKVSFARGSGGHKGVASIINKLGTKDFIRVRVGVAKISFWPWQKEIVKRPNSGKDLEKFVLSNFGKKEQEILVTAKEKACLAVKMIIAQGYVVAMNHFNQN